MWHPAEVVGGTKKQSMKTWHQFFNLKMKVLQLLKYIFCRILRDKNKKT